eukprot:6936453-Pyramimonas_sp.AAC.1
MLESCRIACRPCFLVSDAAIAVGHSVARRRRRLVQRKETTVKPLLSRSTAGEFDRLSPRLFADDFDAGRPGAAQNPRAHHVEIDGDRAAGPH